ncbi:MAG: nitrous oxide reductase family maturation protein NosD, partial [Thermomicrobiales bacterium]|nr:nitrous oxide reductase family maturation protein NosD [Thermomicrobiales bacterium]
MLRGSAGRLRRWLAVMTIAAIPLLAVAASAAGQEGAADVVVCPTCDVTSLEAALATATPGATIEVRGGVYPGGLVIERPVQLIGIGQPVIDGGGEGTIVTIRNTTATLNGFDLRGTGDNLDHEDAAIVVENATATLTANRIEDALFGIYLKQAPDTVLRDNVILSKDVPTPRK